MHLTFQTGIYHNHKCHGHFFLKSCDFEELAMS